MACSRVEWHASPDLFSNGYYLRPFEAGDGVLVARWCSSLDDLRWVAPCTPPPLTAEKVRGWHHNGVSPFLFYNPNHEPVGYGELVPSITRMGEVWIAHLVVDPNRRNEGIGRLFVLSLLDKVFHDYRAESAFLSVFEDNVLGRACYRHCGFRECGSRKLRPVWLSEDEPLVDMRIELFDWLANHWKESLKRLTAGTDWPLLYNEFRRLRFEWDPTLRDRQSLILSQIPCEKSQPLMAADLGSGPGILAESIAENFPNAEVWAFDADPLQVLMGEEALMEKFGKRIHFELADLREPAWSLGRAGIFAFSASSLALHWMNRDSLRRFYRILYSTLKPGGVFANADHISLDNSWSHSFTVRKTREAARPRIPWDEYWRSLKESLNILYSCEQMASDLPVYEGMEQGQSMRAHSYSLENAGFSGIRELWREDGDAVIVAVK